MEKFHRYLDSDNDGIPYRTLPGEHPKGAYFTRGSGHNKYGGYTEDPDEYREVMERLLTKWETAKTLVPEPVALNKRGATSGILAVGSSDGAVREALDGLETQGLPFDYMCVKAFPFNNQVQEFLDKHERVFVVEQNRDAQLRSLLVQEMDVSKRKLISVLHYDGFPIGSNHVLDGVMSSLEQGSAA
jgi:2-oxoglutarate ferredoxin oxidoreductase subunit alpha